MRISLVSCFEKFQRLNAGYLTCLLCQPNHNSNDYSLINGPAILSKEFLFNQYFAEDESTYEKYSHKAEQSPAANELIRNSPSEFLAYNDNSSEVVETVDKFKFRINLDDLDSAIEKSGIVRAQQITSHDNDVNDLFFDQKFVDRIREASSNVSQDDDAEILNIEIDEDEFFKMMVFDSESKTAPSNYLADPLDSFSIPYNAEMMTTANKLLSAENLNSSESVVDQFNKLYPMHHSTRIAHSDNFMFSNSVWNQYNEFDLGNSSRWYFTDLSISNIRNNIVGTAILFVTLSTAVNIFDLFSVNFLKSLVKVIGMRKNYRCRFPILLMCLVVHYMFRFFLTKYKEKEFNDIFIN